MAEINGLITIRSSLSPEETLHRLQTVIAERGLEIFAHIDHAKEARKVGLSLAPTDVVIFGNAKVGTPLMSTLRTIGLDLPLKVLVWQDDSGITWLTYTDPAWLHARHGGAGDTAGPVSLLSEALSAVSKAAAQRDGGR